MLDVHPETREGLPGGALALRDLVLVMGEDQIHATGVDVDRRAVQQPQRHRGALDVPARPARSHAEIPCRLAGFGRLPQHEVASVLFLVAVRVNPCAHLDRHVVEPREPTVLRERRDPEIDGPVAPVGVAVGFERPNRVGHRAQVILVGGARACFDRLEPERVGILSEGGDVAVGILT